MSPRLGQIMNKPSSLAVRFGIAFSVSAALLPLAATAAPSSISIGDASVQQQATGLGELRFTLTRTGDLRYPVVVPYTTVDDSAIAGADYSAVSGSAIISVLSSSTNVVVPVLAGTNTVDKSFFLNLAGATGIGPTPSFGDAADTGAGTNPQAIAAGDFNGDGKPDLAVVSAVTNSVAILFNGTPPGAVSASYTLVLNVAVGSVPTAVAVGDFNGDGKPDLAVANQGDNTVTVLLNSTAPGAASASFTLAANVGVGVGAAPAGIVVADLNGDGKPDLVAANLNGNSISFLLNLTPASANTSSASFALVGSAGVGAAPVAIAAGDLDGDGRPDLVVANLNGNSVSVLLSSSAGGVPNFGVGARPVSVAIGDFNGDGKPDLAVANQGGNSVSILLNGIVPGTGIASFTLAASPGVGAAPAAIAVGDFNGDGKPDLAVANNGSNSVSVLLDTTPASSNTTSASFLLETSPGAGNSPAALAVADFDGDGKPDLATANYSANSVSVLLNATSASTAALAFGPSAAPGAGSTPLLGAVGDFNGDGKPDLAVANQFGNTVSILLNSTAPGAASASFALVASPGAGANPVAAAVGDFNGDGKPDLAVVNQGSSTVSILLNSTPPGAASASFTLAASPGVGSLPQSVAVGDFNGDGKPDLAVANSNGNTVSILLNSTPPGAPSASFTLAASPGVGAYPISVAVGDFNGDGKPDLATADANGNSVSILLNSTAPGTASANFILAASLGVGNAPYSVAVGDFNGDGQPDLAVVNFNDRTASILLNSTAPGAASASFSLAASPGAGFNPEAVAVGDFNGDGKPDLAVPNGSVNTVSILLNSTAPGAATANFTLAASRGVGSSPYSIAVGDFNGDGQPDLATANYSDSNTSVLLNTRLQASLSDTFAVGTITARPDTTPDRFRFIDISNVPLNSVQTSNTVAITGINAPTPISIIGGLYSIGCTEGGFTGSSGMISPGQSVCVRVTASAQNSVETRGRLLIGGVGGGFSATTVAGDTTPDPFQFIDLNDVPLNTQVTSNSVTMTGLTAPAPISVSKGQYSIGCAKRGFTNAPGTIQPGQSVCVRYHSSSKYSDTNNTTLTIGGVSDSFTTTTIAAPAP